MNKWIWLVFTFSYAVSIAGPLELTILKPIEGTEKYFDPYAWWPDANCSFKNDELDLAVGKKFSFTESHFSGRLVIHLKNLSHSTWSEGKSAGVLGRKFHGWTGKNLEGKIEFTSRNGVVHATDIDRGGCKFEFERKADGAKTDLRISFICEALPAVQYLEGRKRSGLMSFEIPADYPIVCKDVSF